MRILLAALAAFLTAACAPEYNWREVRSAEHGYVVMLPAKPASMTRTIRLEALEVPMTMQGARVGDTSFTVAVATLPDASPETRARAVAAMRAGMVHNLGGTEREAVAVRVRVVDSAGAALGEEPGTRVDVEGRAQGRAVSMRGGFVGRGDLAYQWLVLGPTIDDEQALTFLDSFRLMPVVR
jgi:hypothetical protein